MTTVLTVVGARPQFIKASAVSPHLRALSGTREVLVHTGQHYDANMSDVFFDELGIPAPDYHLGVGSGAHGAQTARMLEGIESLIQSCKPDVLLIYGDTNSTLAGALAAAKLHVPVAHVEAGLRSFNRMMPEEINRVVADHLSSLLFAPTDAAVDNLRAEGIDASMIVCVGDVMYDAALQASRRAEIGSRILEKLALCDGEYVLATIHRAENTDHSDRLAHILEALSVLARRTPVVLPIHPRTRAAIERHPSGANLLSSGVRVIDPVGYIDMVALEAGASVIVTDSGGVQKEAYFHGIRCVTLRDETEWVELVHAGWNTLVPPTSAAAIMEGVQSAMNRELPARTQLYGDGTTGARIAKTIQCRFGSSR